jgi:hypothetical protein
MSRNGKIARLPVPIRDQVNHRLESGENGRDIIAWLNSSKDVAAVLSSEFNGAPINDENLSHWRQGGFRDWQMQQSALAEARRIISEGGELDQIGEKTLADKLAVWLLGRYIVVTRKLKENEDDPAAWKLLRELCHDLVALRRGDHFAEWLRIDREKLELQCRRDEREANKKSNANPDTTPPLPPVANAEKQRRFREIFGMEPQ